MSRRLSLSVVTVVCLALASMQTPVLAACTCYYDDGLTTPASIVIDGDMADWAPVLGDPDMNTCDGPSGGIIDRDPSPGTGRDLSHFAFSPDSSAISIFTERVGSSSNNQNFAYYVDTDLDGLMDSGEPIIGAKWKGSNRLVEVFVFEYVAFNPGGDPMTDSQGFADGYSLPGSFANVSNTPDRSGTWGSADGLSMEFRILWTELGIPPGSIWNFHVSASNNNFNSSSFSSGIDDNLAGCGGGAGSIPPTPFANLAFVPNVALTGRHAETVVAAHTLNNNGNVNDTFDFSEVISGSHTPTVTYYHDVDGSGDLSAPDSVLSDTDGDTVPDTGLLAPSTAFDLLIAYLIGDNAPWDPSGTATIETFATSSYDTSVSRSVVNTVDVILDPDVVASKSVVTIQDPVNGTTNPKAIPGGVVEYTVQVTNEGGGTADNDTAIITDPIPVLGALFVDDVGGPGSGPVRFTDGSPSSNLAYTFGTLGDLTDDVEFSNDGGATFTYVPVADADGFDGAVTHLRVNPKGVLAAATAGGSPSFEISLRISVD